MHGAVISYDSFRQKKRYVKHSLVRTYVVVVPAAMKVKKQLRRCTCIVLLHAAKNLHLNRALIGVLRTKQESLHFVKFSTNIRISKIPAVLPKYTSIRLILCGVPVYYVEIKFDRKLLTVFRFPRHVLFDFPSAISIYLHGYSLIFRMVGKSIIGSLTTGAVRQTGYGVAFDEGHLLLVKRPVKPIFE